jgi:hypothetical protein
LETYGCFFSYSYFFLTYIHTHPIQYPPKNFQDVTLKQSMTISFHILNNSLPSTITSNFIASEVLLPLLGKPLLFASHCFPLFTGRHVSCCTCVMQHNVSPFFQLYCRKTESDLYLFCRTLMHYNNPLTLTLFLASFTLQNNEENANEVFLFVWLEVCMCVCVCLCVYVCVCGWMGWVFLFHNDICFSHPN